MVLWSNLIKLGQQGELSALEAACRHPEPVQTQLLLRHVKKNADTQFGRQHGFGSVRTLDDFRQRVPVAGYEAFSPFIDRMLHGERNVLVAGAPVFWSATAGTTGWRKVFPITAGYMRQLQATMHLWVAGALMDHPAVLHGAILHFVAPARLDLAHDGVPIGNMSGYNYLKLPGLVVRRLALPWQAFEPRDAAVRAYVSTRMALAHPLTWLFAISSHPLHQLLETLRAHPEALLRDLRDGGLTADVPSELRRELAPHLLPKPELARAIQARMRYAGGLTARAVWPDLKLLSCWTHGPGATFLPDIMAAVPGCAVRAPAYASSEGWFSIPQQDGDAPGVLALHAGFYEFIPVDDAGVARGDPLLAHELKHGSQYSMVITNGTGLARYRMDDVVAVDGFVGRTPRIRFLGKLSANLGAVDGTTELHAARAMEQACAALELEVVRWALATSARRGTTGARRYTFLLERGPGGAETPDAALAAALEEALQEANPSYAAARYAGRLAAVSVSRVEPGGFARVASLRVAQDGAGEPRATIIREQAVRDLFPVAQETVP